MTLQTTIIFSFKDSEFIKNRFRRNGGLTNEVTETARKIITRNWYD